MTDGGYRVDLWWVGHRFCTAMAWLFTQLSADCAAAAKRADEKSECRELERAMR